MHCAMDESDISPIFGNFFLENTSFDLGSDRDLQQLLTDLDQSNELENDFPEEVQMAEDIRSESDIQLKNFVDEESHDDKPKENTPVTSESRFKKLSEAEINDIESHAQSESTKRNTRWGIAIFEAWCIESGKPKLDLSMASPVVIADYLREFYASATPMQTEARKKNLPGALASEYHKNSLKNLRAALNRKIKDCRSDVDIVRDKVFDKANLLLNAKLKLMAKSGQSRPTQHKKIIQGGDLEKIKAYLNDESDAEILMLSNWFNLAVHFVSRGLEFHHQLMTSSFDFSKDDTGREYVTLKHETQQKNIQGGVSETNIQSEKRMYATGGRTCPVKTLKLFLSHCDPGATSLFCRSKKNISDTVWYSTKPISKRMFSDFMQRISKVAKCSIVYTAHCLRATAIHMLSQAGVELRHIMLMSGHRNEASVRSYSRDCSSVQKRAMSDILADQNPSDALSLVPSCHVTEIQKRVPAATFPNPDSNTLPLQSPAVPASNTSVNISAPKSLLSSRGILNNSSFENCQFSIYMNHA